jgi:NAD(P)-dependent dehydrogenase (short-subunit alcohol dehydrogenase family)
MVAPGNRDPAASGVTPRDGTSLAGSFIEMTASASSEIQEIAVITGASTGIGAATARELARRGFHVLAGVRRDRDADAIRGPGIEPLIIDITNPDHIRALAARVHRDPHGRAVRALVNNAGIGVNVPVEVFAIDEWRRLFEVNLFGHVAVTQALLPALIRSKGRVVNISSVGGKIAMATYGPYAGTKFALEAVSDSLRRELAPFGVGVVVVEPGAVRTEMPGRAIATAQELASTMTPEQSQRYGALVQAITAQSASHTKSGLPAGAAAKVIAKAVTTRKPRTRYAVGRDAAMITRLVRILPDRTLDRVLAAALRPHFPKESK